MRLQIDVAMCFKNEAHILEEWINHYIDEGIDNFLLCNNNSTDNYESILKKYDNIKLWNDRSDVVQWNCEGPRGKYGGNIYSKMISKSIADWIIIVDSDEFVYAREGYDTIRDFLLDKGDEFNQILINSLTFHNKAPKYVTEKQPDSVIEGFVYSSPDQKLSKSIVKRKALIKTEIHEHVVEGRTTTGDLLQDYDMSISTWPLNNNLENTHKGRLWRVYPKDSKVYLHCNHYRYQSKEYWFDTKCKRGYADRVSDKVKGKSQRMKEWWNANTLDYKKDTELRDKKRLKQN